MKKMIGLILTLFIIASLLSGCGKEAVSAPTPTPSPVATKAPDATVTPAPTNIPEQTATPFDMEKFLKDIAASTANSDLQAVAEEIIKNPYFVLYRIENTEWYYPGMNYEFKPEGIKEILCITDYVSNAGSLVYVMIPNDGADPAAIAESFKNNADPQWMNYDKPTDGMVTVIENGRIYFSMYDTAMQPVLGTIATRPRDFKDIFHEYLADHPAATTEELADYFIKHQKFNNLYVNPVEPGRLNGFGTFEKDVQITGFAEGTGFVPMISPNLFIGYVFKLDAGSDVNAFVAMLKENANLSWNVCMTANTVFTETDGNYVLFMMFSE